MVLFPPSDNSMAEAETRHDGGGDGAAAAYKKGAWSKEEDEKLKRAVEEFGDRNWVKIERFSGLARPAKNCRLRWLNYLRPNLKKYPFTKEEEDLIFDLHAKYGNTWSRIASKLPGRSDNEIKNFWHKRNKKREREKLRICPTPKPNNQNHTNCSNESISIAAPHLSNTLFSSFSPLNLHLSMPESCLPIQDSIHELNSASPIQPINDHSLPSLIVPPTQFNPPHENSYMLEPEPDSNLEIIDELKKAQARVRFLKRKLRQRGISNKTNLFKRSSRNQHFFIQNPEEIVECRQGSINSELSTNSDSKALDEIFTMKNSGTFQNSTDLLNHGNTHYSNLWNEENIVSESSTLLQELEGDFFQIDEPSSQVYSQRPLKAADESGQLSYVQEFSDVRFPEQGLIMAAESLPAHQNNAVDLLESTNLGAQHFSLKTSSEHSAATQLYQSSFIQQQYHEAHLINSSYPKSNQNSEYLEHPPPSASMRYVECPRSQADEFYGGITEGASGEETWKEEFMAEKLWEEDQTFFTDRFDFIC